MKSVEFKGLALEVPDDANWITVDKDGQVYSWFDMPMYYSMTDEYVTSSDEFQATNITNIGAQYPYNPEDSIKEI